VQNHRKNLIEVTLSIDATKASSARPAPPIPARAGLWRGECELPAADTPFWNDNILLYRRQRRLWQEIQRLTVVVEAEDQESEES
jgi:hypothetical protein